MKPIAFLLLLLAFAGCGSLKQDKITITGTALNAKAGAIVQTSTNAYYIDGLPAWDSNTYGKRITVSGYLKQVRHEPSDDGIVRQEMQGLQLIITSPKWD